MSDTDPTPEPAPETPPEAPAEPTPAEPAATAPEPVLDAAEPPPAPTLPVESLHQLRYIGGLEAVEESGRVVAQGDQVEVPANRAADLLEHDPPDWELVDPNNTPTRVTMAAEPPKGG